MFPFSAAVTPAARTHVDAQVSFINDLSKSIFKSFQQVCDLNIQLAQTMLEETTMATHKVATHSRPAEAIDAVSARAQPTAEKLRAYQQHLSRVAADSQVELANVTEQHVQETTRTAKALADEVMRVGREESERSMRDHAETVRNFTDPFSDSSQPRAGGHTQGVEASASTGKQSTSTTATGTSSGHGTAGAAAH